MHVTYFSGAFNLSFQNVISAIFQLICFPCSLERLKENVLQSTEVYMDSLDKVQGERGGLMVNASDSGSRGRGFEPHSGQIVLCP